MKNKKLEEKIKLFCKDQFFVEGNQQCEEYENETVSETLRRSHNLANDFIWFLKNEGVL